MAVTAYIALGSNLGDRRDFLDRARPAGDRGGPRFQLPRDGADRRTARPGTVLECRRGAANHTGTEGPVAGAAGRGAVPGAGTARALRAAHDRSRSAALR